MKTDKKNYNKLKRYWRLLLKSQDDLNNSKWKKWWCFDELMTESDVVNYLINTNNQLKETYELYQNLLNALKNNKLNELEHYLNEDFSNVSSYMKKSIKH